MISTERIVPVQGTWGGGGSVAEPEFWQAVRNTFLLVIPTALVELVVGILTALLIWWRFWGRALVFLSVFVPWAFPAMFSVFV